MEPRRLVTTLGPRSRKELGAILSHEHVFLDLRLWDEPSCGEVDVEDVVRQISPLLAQARRMGVGAVVEPTTLGVGRRADVLRAVSDASGMPLVVPTGVYREPWIPPWVHDAREEELRHWMVSELEGEIAGSGVRAGWIKVSAGDDGLTETETKVLRAAAKAAVAAEATVGSHTVRGEVALRQLDVVESEGLSPERFVWIHGQREPNFSLHREMAQRGAWLEYDGIGRRRTPQGSDDRFVQFVLKILEAGLFHRLLLSGDILGYAADTFGGGEVEPYTYLIENFLPKLAEAGVSAETIRLLTHDNPFNAFSR